jgi:hypothetical protein
MTAPLTVADVRRLIGPLADGKSDAEIAALRDRFMDFARAVFTAIDSRRQVSR